MAVGGASSNYEKEGRMRTEQQMRDSQVTIFGGASRRQNSISLSELAQFYGTGVSRQRVQQIESTEVVSRKVKQRYIAAFQKAVRHGRLLVRIARLVAANDRVSVSRRNERTAQRVL